MNNSIAALRLFGGLFLVLGVIAGVLALVPETATAISNSFGDATLPILTSVLCILGVFLGIISLSFGHKTSITEYYDELVLKKGQFVDKEATKTLNAIIKKLTNKTNLKINTKLALKQIATQCHKQSRLRLFIAFIIENNHFTFDSSGSEPKTSRKFKNLMNATKSDDPQNPNLATMFDNLRKLDMGEQIPRQ